MKFAGIEERAVNAYKAKGLKAKAGQFLPYDTGVCCALGALFGDAPAYAGSFGNFTTHAANELDAGTEDVWSFIYAFDRNLDPGFALETSADWYAERKAAYPESYGAGKRTAEAVIAAGLKA